MKRVKRYLTFFAVGGTGYAVIELLWRRRTHWTMMLAGGICFVIFSLIAEGLCDRPLALKATVGALGVTAVELVFGVIFNIALKMNVWDYSGVPFNFLGQICPLFTLIWGGLGLIFIPLADAINKKMA